MIGRSGRPCLGFSFEKDGPMDLLARRRGDVSFQALDDAEPRPVSLATWPR